MNDRLQPAGSQYISLPIKNEYVSVLGNYKVSPFKETHSDTACIVRIIEIFSLNKLRAKGEKLYSLTGLTVPDTEAVANEINLLLSRYQSKILTGNTGNKKWCVTTRYLLIMLTGNRLNPFKSIRLHVLPVLHVQNKR